MNDNTAALGWCVLLDLTLLNGGRTLNNVQAGCNRSVRGPDLNTLDVVVGRGAHSDRGEAKSHSEDLELHSEYIEKVAGYQRSCCLLIEA